MLSRTALGLAASALACGGAPRADEPTATGACPGGDAVVQIEAEAAALAGCAALPGDLTVGPSFTLASATGLGAVRDVGGALEVSDNLSLPGVYMGGLVAVDGDVIIENNRALATASLHRLTEVGGDLIVRGNRALERLDLAALRRVGGRVRIAEQPVLEAVELGALRSAGSIEIDDVPVWPPEEIDDVKRRVVHPDAAQQPRGSGEVSREPLARSARAGARRCGSRPCQARRATQERIREGRAWRGPVPVVAATGLDVSPSRTDRTLSAEILE